jgi:hypothetical protein
MKGSFDEREHEVRRDVAKVSGAIDAFDPDQLLAHLRKTLSFGSRISIWPSAMTYIDVAHLRVS